MRLTLTLFEVERTKDTLTVSPLAPSDNPTPHDIIPLPLAEITFLAITDRLPGEIRIKLPEELAQAKGLIA